MAKCSLKKLANGDYSQESIQELREFAIDAFNEAFMNIPDDTNGGLIKKAAERKKDTELVKAWENIIAILDSLRAQNIPAISLEDGDTVIWNNERYTITDKENLIGKNEVTGELVTLTTDNLIKEETQCIPVKFKMI